MKSWRWCRWMLAMVCAFPVWVSAQILTFEGVCVPPTSCPIGTFYGPAGVTFTPSTHQVWGGNSNGNPGGWGVEGTNGPSFLGFNGSPSYSVQLNLARNATYFSVDVSRTSGSTDGTFTLTLFNGAAQVFTDTVTLGAINSWQTVTASVPGGFNIAVLTGAGTGFHPFAVDNIHIGGNCFGFSDVQPSDSFCNATEWLANRGVTLGCALGQYCPANNVNRAQMALFMNRLGDALTPFIVSVEDSPGAVDPDVPPVVCQTADIAPVGYDRTAVITGTFAGAAAGALEFQHKLRRSSDGGASWVSVTSNFNRSGTTAAHWISATVSDSTIIPAGSTYRFGIEIARDSGTADFTSSRCFLTVQAFSRSGTSAPFDPAPAAQGDGAKR